MYSMVREFDRDMLGVVSESAPGQPGSYDDVPMCDTPMPADVYLGVAPYTEEPVQQNAYTDHANTMYTERAEAGLGHGEYDVQVSTLTKEQRDRVQSQVHDYLNRSHAVAVVEV